VGALLAEAEFLADLRKGKAFLVFEADYFVSKLTNRSHFSCSSDRLR
jgi:hypothetical protein